jgi:hypothetical protein
MEGILVLFEEDLVVILLKIPYSADIRMIVGGSWNKSGLLFAFSPSWSNDSSNVRRTSFATRLLSSPRYSSSPLSSMTIIAFSSTLTA